MVEFIGEDISINIHHNRKADYFFMQTVLSAIPSKAGLTAYQAPRIYEFPNENAPNEYGVSGFQLMVESHVGGHDWIKGRANPGTPYCHITISSCKKVNVGEVIKYLKDVFMTEKIICETTPWRNPG